MSRSIYLGSCGRIPEAFHWSHTTSTKCIALVKKHQHSFSEAFRRLFWISFICESDFISEISIIQPSGIARYQDQVPYPTQASPTSQNESHAPSTLDSGVASPFEEPTGGNGRESRRDEGEELAAFQICTNIAIRRLLNSVHSLVYDSKDHFRMKRVEYVRWLLRVTGDFWTYHGTIYRNVPQFLFVSMPPWRDNTHIPMSQPQSHHTPRTEGLGNDPWNVLRLQGRYYASQHIIHRPFVDYVLINMDHIQTHPDLDTILQKCALCFEGCKGFISVFNINEANSITCLFATGVACVIIQTRTSLSADTDFSNAVGPLHTLLSCGWLPRARSFRMLFRMTLRKYSVLGEETWSCLGLVSRSSSTTSRFLTN